MRNKQKNKKKNTFFIELIGGLVILIMLILLFNKYYDAILNSESVKLNPRYVIIDYEQLEQEANSIIISNPTAKENAENVIVLTYHVVSNYPPIDDYEISYDQFKNNMFTLKSQGYNTVSLQDFNLFLSGKKKLPDKSFLITFDDGARAAFYNADPILKVLNYTAVMFVITGQSLEVNKSPYYLNETELINVQQTGRWELESHTHESHFRLPINSQGDIAPALTNKLWIDKNNRLETDEEYLTRVEEDIETSKMLLETKLNKTVTAFALPYGDFGERGSNYDKANYLLHNLTGSNFKMIFYEFPIKDLYYKGNYPDNNPEFHIVGRLPADIFRNPESLMQRIDASSAIKLPYIEEYSSNDRWPRISGIATFEDDLITLKSNSEFSDETILMAYLDGSYLWEDYRYSIQIVNKEKGIISLLSRLTITGDYVLCQFKNEKVTLINIKNGVHEKIKSVLLPENVSLKEETFLSMSVSGPIVKCSIDRKNILSTSVPGLSPRGGVGIKMEDYDDGNMTFSYRNVTIIPI